MTAQAIILSTGRRVALETAEVEELCRLIRPSRSRATRDLSREIETYLYDDQPATAIEIARGIRARNEDVRRVLRNDRRFQHAQAGTNRSPRAKVWKLARSRRKPVPEPGTTARASG